MAGRDSTHDGEGEPRGGTGGADGHAEANEFESGLDYGAFIEEDDEPAAPGREPEAEVSPNAPEDVQATESIDRAELDGDAGTQSTQSIDRAELDAWAAGDAAGAEDRPAAQGLGAGAAGRGAAPDTAQDDYRGFATGAQTADGEDRRRDLRDAEARALARDEALDGPTAGPKVLQVLLAVFFPIVVLIAAVRAVASPVFLWIEYHRPGFPADELGLTTEDRLTYGSAGMDYLFNAAPARYLSELQYQGNQLFTDSEVSHMADVKLVMLITMAAGAVLALLCIVFMVALARTTKGGIRRSLFAGSLWMLVVLIAVAVLAVLGWETFFAGFHSLFFADGTWTFQASDALIRLYPNQFWMDAGIGIAALVLVTLIVTLVCTWPTRRRRQDSRLAQADLIRRRNDWYDSQEA